ncbi:hypothetical protein BVG16_05405 [Paenibacillus selenitireducens]|uniref:Uncharacterized protein n=1 Tax=Paenibacillus selenitireducens TaxID=1324314 RepID=A0A1T2XKG7_9BACL|nr:hypothetical protein [Paenibacillus selenitireducens]OPA80183.1 hypothetical protein BVG16_05405 [Paenibacillus selenitireducens]
MKVHYIAANRYHLSVIRPSEQGFIIDPLEHSILEHPNELLLEAQTDHIGICQDEQQFIHMIYINRFDEIIHAILHPYKYTVQFHSIDRNAKDVMDIQLGCHSNRLHLFMVYHNRIEYRQLSGIHWNEPIAVVESDAIDRVQLLMDNNIIMLGYTVPVDKRTQFCLLPYDHTLEQWLEPFTVYETNDQCQLVPLLAVDSSDTWHIVLFQFYVGQLHLAYFQLHADHQKLHFIADSGILIPQLTIDDATFAIEGQHIRCFWHSDPLLYQLQYQPSTSSWGPIQAAHTESIVKWVAITDHPSFGTISPSWFADSRSIHELNEQTGYGIDQYRSDRDFRQSLLFTERWMSSALSMVQQKEQLLSEQQQFEQTIKHWKDLVAAYKARLLILNEELSIRQALPRHTLHSAPSTQVRPSNNVYSPTQISNEVIADPRSNVVTLDLNGDAGKKSVRDKVVHFLYKLTGNE